MINAPKGAPVNLQMEGLSPSLKLMRAWSGFNPDRVGGRCSS